MRSRLLILLSLMTIAGIISCEQIHIDEQPVVETSEESLVKGEAIVKFDDSLLELIESDLDQGLVQTRSGDMNDIVDRLGIVSMQRLFADAGKYEARTREAGLHRWYKVIYDPEISFTKASETLDCIDGVGVVEPVRDIAPRHAFNDPLLSYQWGFVNDGSLSEMHSAGVDINIDEVWEDGTVYREDVIVAVVDGGIDQNHVDLSSNCIGGYNFVRNSIEIIPEDHGTHVAGTIAAINNNGVGVCGIAGGDALRGIPGVKVLSCQIFEPDPQSPGDVIGGTSGAEAIKWAADNGAVIAQNSWGYVFDSYADAKRAKIERSLKEAIDYFIRYAGVDENGRQTGPMKGGVVIFAAGNDGWDTDPIGKYEPVLSVGAVAPDGRRTSYSNHGDWVDIAAPGGSFESNECYILSTAPGNRYGYMNGTSMACPHVSGAAALIVSKFGGPDFTPEELRKRLIEGGDYSTVPPKEDVGPLLDVWSSLSDLPDQTPERVQGLSVSAGAQSVELMWDVSANAHGVLPVSYMAYLSERTGFLKTMDPSRVPIDVMVVKVGAESKKDGDIAMCRFTGLNHDTVYEVAVVAIDRLGNRSDMSEVLQVRTSANRAPVLKLKGAHDSVIAVGAHESCTLEYEVYDPDGHTFSVYINGAGKSLTYDYNENAGEMEVIIKGDGFRPGSYSAEIVAVDAYGAKNSLTLEYELQENMNPVLLRRHDDVLLKDIGQSVVLHLEEYFEDKDGGDLRYEIRISDNQTLDHVLDKDMLTIRSLAYGVAQVTVRAGDSYGYSETMRFRILVRNAENPIVLYPNPVIDNLHVRVIEDGEYTIEVYSSAGTSVGRYQKTLTPFDDLRLDMTGLAPGNYEVSVTSKNHIFKNNIIKL